MNIKLVKDTPIHKNSHNADVRQMYDSNNAQAIHLTLQAGQSLKPHITPVDVFFYILEGSPDIQVGDETLPVEKDSLVESPKDIVHCISNNSNVLARILVVKTPKPMAKTIMV